MLHIPAAIRIVEHFAAAATVGAADNALTAVAESVAVDELCQLLHSNFRMRSRFVRTVDMTSVAYLIKINY